MLSSVSAPRGTLVVTVYEGVNLEREDTFGKNDAFVELWLDKDYKQRTEVLKDQESPVWNQTFTFPIEEGSKHHKLYLRVLDKDTAGTDDIGEGKVDFTSVYEGEQIDTLVDLPKHLHLSSHGQIHVGISFNRDE